MELQSFKHEQLGAVRCWRSEDDKIYFLAKDVAQGLGYEHTPHMVRMLDDDEKGVQNVYTLGGEQKMTVISESGFYHAALKSRSEKAQLFRKWVTSEVLPQIRKTGGYIPVQAEDDEKTILARALEIMKRTVDQQHQLLEEQKPKVQFAEAVTRCENSILIRDLAKLITQNGVKIGQGRLFYWLRSHGYICKQTTRPLQKWVEQGIFVTDLRVYDYEGHELEHCTTRVTGKGQQYFVNGFLSGKFDAENK